MLANKKNITLLFKQHSIYNTATRIGVMRVLMLSETMLSLPDILKKINYSHDRVTVYRVLRMFCKKQLIYKLVDLQNNAYYRFNNIRTTNDFAMDKDRIFFKCIQCGSITIMENGSMEYPLPEGFVKTATNFLITGYCEHCT